MEKPKPQKELKQSPDMLKQQKNKDIIKQKSSPKQKVKTPEELEDDTRKLVEMQLQNIMPEEQQDRSHRPADKSPQTEESLIKLDPKTSKDDPMGQSEPGSADPKLYVDVNIGKQGMERIVVYEGDTAEGLARDFCQQNGLPPDMQEKLKMLLEQQIAGVLPKIVEDDANESEEDSTMHY